MSKRKTVRAKRGFIRTALLNILSNLEEATFQIIDEGFFNLNYVFTGFGRDIMGLNKKSRYSCYKRRNVKLRRNIFAVTLHRLRKEGLVEKQGSYKDSIWRITVVGRDHLKREITKFNRLALLPKDGKIRIVSFDITEKERWKRDRLRSWLRACEYEMLQRSLWVGRRPLPNFVFSQIKQHGLRHCVHVFEISQRGTTHGLI